MDLLPFSQMRKEKTMSFISAPDCSEVKGTAL